MSATEAGTPLEGALVADDSLSGDVVDSPTSWFTIMTIKAFPRNQAIAPNKDGSLRIMGNGAFVTTIAPLVHDPGTPSGIYAAVKATAWSNLVNFYPVVAEMEPVVTMWAAFPNAPIAPGVDQPRIWWWLITINVTIPEVEDRFYPGTGARMVTTSWIFDLTLEGTVEDARSAQAIFQHAYDTAQAEVLDRYPHAAGQLLVTLAFTFAEDIPVNGDDIDGPEPEGHGTAGREIV
ncbi:hypothetical protein ACFC1T_09030 [Kitasatospora sp. NPDC056076]|uniref:hypothetical protein n=1 Tax=Kitasatospora sp. NPDC056076 TaxID=3345703 RepID=UPI0035D6D41A